MESGGNCRIVSTLGVFGINHSDVGSVDWGGRSGVGSLGTYVDVTVDYLPGVGAGDFDAVDCGCCLGHVGCCNVG